MIQNVDELLAKLEQTGEPTVRNNLAKGVYGQEKIPLVIEWLRQKEQFRGEQLASESIKTTKRANLAAWIAACAAIASVLVAIAVYFACAV